MKNVWKNACSIASHQLPPGGIMAVIYHAAGCSLESYICSSHISPHEILSDPPTGTIRTWGPFVFELVMANITLNPLPSGWHLLQPAQREMSECDILHIPIAVVNQRYPEFVKALLAELREHDRLALENHLRESDAQALQEKRREFRCRTWNRRGEEDISPQHA